MEVVVTDKAKEDISFWKKSGNAAVQKRISMLLEAIVANPFKGPGKPEPLRYGLSGAWSRRINKEHRLVYEMDGDRIIIHSLKGHY